MGIVDADYLVHPEFLSACVPYLADPHVAFVQTPQLYREWEDSTYLRGLFHAYRYFFDVTMVARARVNAIIFGGTMGLIRLSALREIGGWAEWCITEDAEASLRLLARGWTSVYLNRPMGEGLMPLDFDGLRRQRFRWAFGGVQILRRHIGLMLGARPSRLTLAQRYHYLAGGLGWFGDLVSVGLGFFLLLTAPLLALGHPLLLRQLSGVLLVMPLYLLVSGLVRLGWGLKVATGASWRVVPAALVVMLALSWTVTRACIRGLLQEQGVFLRTPKVGTPSRLGRARLSTSTESVIAAGFLAASVPVLMWGPRPLAPMLGVLLGWQALAWSSAPLASLLAQGVRLTATRTVFRRSPQNTGTAWLAWQARGRRFVLAPALAIVGFLLLAPGLVAGGGDQDISKTLGLPATPIPARAATPKPSQSSARSPRATVAATSSPANGAIPTASAVPTASGLPTPSSAPTPTPGPSSTLESDPLGPAHARPASNAVSHADSSALAAEPP